MKTLTQQEMQIVSGGSLLIVPVLMGFALGMKNCSAWTNAAYSVGFGILASGMSINERAVLNQIPNNQPLYVATNAAFSLVLSQFGFAIGKGYFSEGSQD